MPLEPVFDYLNPYQNLEEITASTPEKLVRLIKSIKKPVTIIQIVASDRGFTAFIKGDFKKATRRKDNG